jgi:RIO-like serine/threonine protein kinase
MHASAIILRLQHRAQGKHLPATSLSPAVRYAVIVAVKSLHNQRIVHGDLHEWDILVKETVGVTYIAIHPVHCALCVVCNALPVVSWRIRYMKYGSRR